MTKVNVRDQFHATAPKFKGKSTMIRKHPSLRTLATSAAVSAALLIGGKAHAEKRPETVSLYLPDQGKDGDVYSMDSVTVVAYPQRPCHLSEIAGYRNLRLATMSRAPVCYFKSDNSVVILSPYMAPAVLPESLFAVARLSPDGESATVFHPGFSSKSGWDRYMKSEQDKATRSMPGAPLPPRDR